MTGNSCSHARKAKWLAILVVLVVGGLLLISCGQAAPKVYRVGILYETPALSTTADGFKAKMTELGYIEGENIIYDVQVSEANPAKNQQIAEKFVEDKVDLIFVFPLMAALTAKEVAAGTDIPVIFSICGLEGNNLVNSVREPGGNITGVRSPIVELPTKSFETMLELVPDMKQAYIPYAANYPAVLPGLEALRKEAEAAGVTLIELPVTTLDELKSDLAAREAADDIGIDAILFLPETLVQSPDGFKILSEFAVKHDLPIGGLIPWEAQQGALYTSGIDMVEMGQLAAPLADKVLKGTQAGTIPVVSPELHLFLNYKRAQELGLTVPDGLLAQAAEVIH